MSRYWTPPLSTVCWRVFNTRLDAAYCVYQNSTPKSVVRIGLFTSPLSQPVFSSESTLFLSGSKDTISRRVFTSLAMENMYEISVVQQAAARVANHTSWRQLGPLPWTTVSKALVPCRQFSGNFVIRAPVSSVHYVMLQFPLLVHAWNMCVYQPSKRSGEPFL